MGLFQATQHKKRASGLTRMVARGHFTVLTALAASCVLVLFSVAARAELVPGSDGDVSGVAANETADSNDLWPLPNTVSDHNHRAADLSLASGLEDEPLAVSVLFRIPTTSPRSPPGSTRAQ